MRSRSRDTGTTVMSYCTDRCAAIHAELHTLTHPLQLLDCAGSFDNKGCSGGLPSHAFEYAAYAGGISEEFMYPYEARSNGTTCRFNNATVGAQVLQSFNITQVRA